MTQRTINFQLFITSILLIIVILFFQYSNLDIKVQNLFFNFETKNWLIDKNEPILKFLLYDGLKKALIIFAVLILLSLIFLRKNEFVKNHKNGLIIILLSSILIPLIIGSLKAITNQPCPCHLEHFGGIYPDIKIFESYPSNFIQESKVKCWPAGHASGGFALMSMFFLFKKYRYLALVFALILGWSMGLYKMLLGDHFLSHTIITMLIAWIVILLLYKTIERKNIEKSA